MFGFLEDIDEFVCGVMVIFSEEGERFVFFFGAFGAIDFVYVIFYLEWKIVYENCCDVRNV